MRTAEEYLLRLKSLIGTKDQWARDDPAFLVLLAVSLALSSILFAIVMSLNFSFGSSLWTV